MNEWIVFFFIKKIWLFTLCVTLLESNKYSWVWNTVFFQLFGVQNVCILAFSLRKEKLLLYFSHFLFVNLFIFISKHLLSAIFRSFSIEFVLWLQLHLIKTVNWFKNERMKCNECNRLTGKYVMDEKSKMVEKITKITRKKKK